MTNLTKNIGTVTLTGAAEKITLPASYGWVWVKNMSEGDIFAGLSEDISEGADGVMVIPSGECGRVQADGFRSVWLLGTGNVQIVGQNYADCPFKAAAKGGGSGGSGGGNYIIQYGIATAGSSGYVSVTFPIPFKTPPTMVVSAISPSTGSVCPSVAYIKYNDNSKFTVYADYYTSGAFRSYTAKVHWIAIGEV